MSGASLTDENEKLGVIINRSVARQHEALSEALAQAVGICVSEIDGGLEEIRGACSEYATSVAVVDISVIERHDWNCIRKFIRNTPAAKVLVHLHCCDKDQLESLLLAGCYGFVHGNTPVSAWEAIVRRVLAGEMCVDRAVFSGAFQAVLAAFDQREFSPREEEILGSVATGMTNQGIAERLFITPATVRWHLRRLYAKAGVSSRPALSTYAARYVRGVKLLRAPDRNFVPLTRAAGA